MHYLAILAFYVLFVHFLLPGNEKQALYACHKSAQRLSQIHFVLELHISPIFHAVLKDFSGDLQHVDKRWHAGKYRLRADPSKEKGADHLSAGTGQGCFLCYDDYTACHDVKVNRFFCPFCIDFSASFFFFLRSLRKRAAENIVQTKIPAANFSIV